MDVFEDNDEALNSKSLIESRSCKKKSKSVGKNKKQKQISKVVGKNENPEYDQVVHVQEITCPQCNFEFELNKKNDEGNKRDISNKLPQQQNAHLNYEIDEASLGLDEFIKREFAYYGLDATKYSSNTR